MLQNLYLPLGLWLLDAFDDFLYPSSTKTPLRSILHPPRYFGPSDLGLCCVAPSNCLGVVVDRSRAVVRRTIIPLCQVHLDKWFLGIIKSTGRGTSTTTRHQQGNGWPHPAVEHECSVPTGIARPEADRLRRRLHPPSWIFPC